MTAEYAPEITFYSKKTAICFALGVSKTKEPVINITGGMGLLPQEDKTSSASYEFKKGQLLQLSAVELTQVIAVLNGFEQKIEVTRPNGVKYFGIKQNDTGSLHCRYVDAESKIFNVAIKPEESIKLLNLAYQAVRKAFPSIPEVDLSRFIPIMIKRRRMSNNPLK